MTSALLQPATLLSFTIGAILASMGEYWTHRLMHMRKVLAKVHTDHHKRNSAQGVFGEMIDYFRGGIPCSLPFSLGLWFLVTPAAGVAFMAGALGYGVFAAYAHQLQHENPRRCFWMPMPVHYVHHKYNMWHHNFGIGVDIWDRVFGTYKVAEWDGEPERALGGSRGLLQIKWV